MPPVETRPLESRFPGCTYKVRTVLHGSAFILRRKMSTEATGTNGCSPSVISWANWTMVSIGIYLFVPGNTLHIFSWKCSEMTRTFELHVPSEYRRNPTVDPGSLQATVSAPPQIPLILLPSVRTRVTHVRSESPVFSLLPSRSHTEHLKLLTLEASADQDIALQSQEAKRRFEASSIEHLDLQPC